MTLLGPRTSAPSPSPSAPAISPCPRGGGWGGGGCFFPPATGHPSSRFDAWSLKFLLSLMLGVLSFSSPAALYTFNPNAPIPDHNPTGLTDSHTISGLLFQITD